MLSGDGLCTRDPEAISSASLLASSLASDGLVQAFDAGSTLGTAQDLGQLSGMRTFGGAVGGTDTADYVRFTLQTSARLTVALGNLSADIDLALYDSGGQRIGLSEKAGTAAESILRSLTAGTYYIGITPWRGAASSYLLTISSIATTTTPATPTTPTNPVTTFPDVPNYGGSNEWNLNSINAPEAWAQGYKGSGVVVAVVDTGVDINHPDLMSQLWVNADEVAGNGIDDDHNGYIDDISGWDFAGGDNNPDDQNGHGTHVAGSIAADDNGFGATGVAPNAKIMPVRVLGSNGSGTAAAVAAGIRYAADNGADIINLSLGGALSSVIQSAIQYALSRDVLVVSAAGNESASTPSYPARFSAALANVISVGAYSSSGALASFSNRVGSSGAVQVDAPGVGVYSTYIDGRYGTLSGTSMATPQVAGLAALALSANPSLTASQLRTLIVTGANDAIGGSDSRGGINAAVTVALARAGITAASTSSVAAAAQSSTTSPFISNRRFGSASVAEFDAVSLLSGPTAASSTIANEIAVRQVLAMPAAESTPVTARQLALVALNLEDGWDLESDADAERLRDLSPDELLLQLLDESAPWA